MSRAQALPPPPGKAAWSIGPALRTSQACQGCLLPPSCFLLEIPSTHKQDVGRDLHGVGGQCFLLSCLPWGCLPWALSLGSTCVQPHLPECPIRKVSTLYTPRPCLPACLGTQAGDGC